MRAENYGREQGQKIRGIAIHIIYVWQEVLRMPPQSRSANVQITNVNHSRLKPGVVLQLFQQN
jgi:hypothetical protein